MRKEYGIDVARDSILLIGGSRMTRSNKTSLDAVPSAAPADERVIRVKLFLDNRGYSQAAFQEAADSVSLSVPHLRHLFKRDIRESPFRYYKAIALERAKHLAETTHLSIKQIQVMLGFKDAKRFRQDIRAAYGATLGQLRARALREKAARSTGRQPPAPDELVAAGEHGGEP